jgi:alpha-D-ribose 1-methylphosphonate 5-phosphate C-P lyase
MYHRYIEIAGAKNSINYDLTEIETNSKDGIVCIKCIAKRNGDTVITYGEASPKNTKNAYPYAMAEKRAVDRAILKLLGLHGFVYSEDEMDLSQTNTNTNSNKVGASDVDVLLKFQEQIDTSVNAQVLKGYGKMYAKAMTKAKSDAPAVYQHTKNIYEDKLKELNGKEINV